MVNKLVRLSLSLFLRVSARLIKEFKTSLPYFYQVKVGLCGCVS